MGETCYAKRVAILINEFRRHSLVLQQLRKKSVKQVQGAQGWDRLVVLSLNNHLEAVKSRMRCITPCEHSTLSCFKQTFKFFTGVLRVIVKWNTTCKNVQIQIWNTCTLHPSNQGSSTLILMTYCPACFTCLPASTHLTETYEWLTARLLINLTVWGHLIIGLRCVEAEKQIKPAEQRVTRNRVRDLCLKLNPEPHYFRDHLIRNKVHLSAI